MERSEVVVS